MIHIAPFLLALVAALASGRAAAHAGSNAYLVIDATSAEVQLRWDLALRDADLALGLDADGDGLITWGETRAAEAHLRDYGRQRLQLGAGGSDCRLQDAAPLQIAEREDGSYAVLRYLAHCGNGFPQSLSLHYSALFELDASHRALLRVRLAGHDQGGLMAPDRQQLEFGGDDRAGRVFRPYFREGVLHVLGGWDHLLFLLGLFLPAVLHREHGRWQPAASLREAVGRSAGVVTAFTLAHALTLCLAALGLLSLPTRWVESAVAATVLFAGLNNLRPMVRERLVWVAGGFGLVHGSAIAGALMELGLPATGRVTALAGFNLGVETAQLCLVALLIPLAYTVRRSVWYLRLVLWPGSALVALAGLVWLLDRTFALGWPLPI